MNINAVSVLQKAPVDGSACRSSMIVTDDRIVYSGLLGVPSTRVFGAHVVYIAHETPFAISIDGAAPEHAWLIAVPANRVHQITSRDRHIRHILVEPESATLKDLALLGQHTVTARTPQYRHLERAFREWPATSGLANASAAELDLFFFGELLTPRTLDPAYSGQSAVFAPPHRNRFRQPSAPAWRTCPSCASCICSSRRSA